MVRKSDNYSTEMTLQQYVKYGLRLRLRAGNALNQNEKQEFTEVLNNLYAEYYHKFERRDDVERPEWASKKSAGIEQPVNISQLNFERRKALYFQICKLQERLGHTKIETQEMESKAPIGGKKKADEIEEEAKE